MDKPFPLTHRRELLTLGGAGLLATFAGTSFGADDESRELSEIEKKNEKLVNDFCASWSTIDIEQIVAFFDDKIIYQMFEGMPDIKGKDAFKERIEPFFSSIERVQWDILRSHVIGNLVINERVDNFYRSDDKPDMHFPVAGLFVVKNGKIVLWRDYSMPKEAQTAAAESTGD